MPFASTARVMVTKPAAPAAYMAKVTKQAALPAHTAKANTLAASAAQIHKVSTLAAIAALGANLKANRSAAQPANMATAIKPAATKSAPSAAHSAKARQGSKVRAAQTAKVNNQGEAQQYGVVGSCGRPLTGVSVLCHAAFLLRGLTTASIRELETRIGSNRSLKHSCMTV
mmetsp:Transcript_25624/g.59214  ORF Transcript_25624/g.59214 Transcript_25624/m.59214 type:complete len:171 (+) Transcript_25624:218-730(+)